MNSGRIEIPITKERFLAGEEFKRNDGLFKFQPNPPSEIDQIHVGSVLSKSSMYNNRDFEYHCNVQKLKNGHLIAYNIGLLGTLIEMPIHFTKSEPADSDKKEPQEHSAAK